MKESKEREKEKKDWCIVTPSLLKWTSISVKLVRQLDVDTALRISTTLKKKKKKKKKKIEQRC